MASSSAIDTRRVAGRRKLRFASIDNALAECERLATADRAGKDSLPGQLDARADFRPFGRLGGIRLSRYSAADPAVGEAHDAAHETVGRQGHNAQPAAASLKCPEAH